MFNQSRDVSTSREDLLEKKDADGFTPYLLAWSCLSGGDCSKAVVLELAALGARIDTKDGKGRTCLQLALEKSHMTGDTIAEVRSFMYTPMRMSLFIFKMPEPMTNCM